MGIACTRVLERVLAAQGKLSDAPPIFTSNVDIKSAGVLFALPALLLNGLLKYSQNLSFKEGYCGLQSILLILAFVALLRIKSLEGVRYIDPGELGKIIGLDRIPEVKTLREKVEKISSTGNPEGWSKELAKTWMEDNLELAGTLYIDGHVRTYHGNQTKLPKRYVARDKLCLRGVTDFWVNDAIGQPFFVITKEVTPGLIAVLKDDVVPRLLKEVPCQPNEIELNQNKYLFRFGVVFDREGYSPSTFKELWEKRIACYTYKKYAEEKWSESEFFDEEVIFPSGEKAKIKIAERGIYFKKEKIWFRELRKLNKAGHQTSLITSDYFNPKGVISVKMFSRWSQENFFKYMMEHYGIDRLIDYKTEDMDETVRVVNPIYRNLDSKIKSLSSKLNKAQAEYGSLILKEEIEESKVNNFLNKKAQLKDLIEAYKGDIEALKKEKKNNKKHIAFSELPGDEKFKKLKTSSKQFMDTIKMIAYRSETAMANILREYIGKKNEARSIVRQIYKTDADIVPDLDKNLLYVNLHNMTNPRNNAYVEKLCTVLNSSQIIFPGTNLTIIYNLVSKQNS